MGMLKCVILSTKAHIWLRKDNILISLHTPTNIFTLPASGWCCALFSACLNEIKDVIERAFTILSNLFCKHVDVEKLCVYDLQQVSYRCNEDSSYSSKPNTRWTWSPPTFWVWISFRTYNHIIATFPVTVLALLTFGSRYFWGGAFPLQTYSGL